MSAEMFLQCFNGILGSKVIEFSYFNHIQPSLVPVLDFLTALHHQGLTYNAIDRLRKGIFQEKPPRPKYTEIWDVSIVLIYLQSLSPVDTLSLKELTLKLVVLILLVSGQRG